MQKPTHIWIQALHHLHYNSIDALLEELQNEIVEDFISWKPCYQKLPLDSVIDLATKLICNGMGSVIK